MGDNPHEVDDGDTRPEAAPPSDVTATGSGLMSGGTASVQRSSVGPNPAQTAPPRSEPDARASVPPAIGPDSLQPARVDRAGVATFAVGVVVGLSALGFAFIAPGAPSGGEAGNTPAAEAGNTPAGEAGNTPAGEPAPAPVRSPVPGGEVLVAPPPQAGRWPLSASLRAPPRPPTRAARRTRLPRTETLRPPVAPEPKPLQPPGRLRIVVQRGGKPVPAAVFIDGLRAGEAPLVAHVPPGVHVVQSGPDRASGPRKSIQVDSGANLKVVLQLGEGEGSEP